MKTYHYSVPVKIGWLLLILIIPFALIGQEKTNAAKRSTRQSKATQSTIVQPVQKDRAYDKSLSTTRMPQSDAAIDIHYIVQFAMRESYLENIEDLKNYADKVKHFNEQKKEIREQLKKNREKEDTLLSVMDYTTNLKSFRLELIISLAETANKMYAKSGQRMSREELVKKIEPTIPALIKKRAYTYSPYKYSTYSNLPKRVPGDSVLHLSQLNNEIVKWEQWLENLNTDDELMNLNLQSQSQKQQQMITLMSNIMKTLHDSQKAIINNIRS